MAITWEDFKQCVRIQGNLDLEAIDVAFVQPLKDLLAWWSRQSAKTQTYISLLTGGSTLAGTVLKESLKAFLKKVVPTGAVDSFYEALAAVLAGVAFGVAMDVMGRCGLQAVENS